MVGVAVRDYKADEAAMLGTNAARAILKKAKECGLDDEQARALAFEACRDNPWAARKFKTFIVENVSAEEVDCEDRLFPWLSSLRPRRENFEKTLSNIYYARSGNLHGGKPFPPWVGLGTSATADPYDVPHRGPWSGGRSSRRVV
jgi:hypothetical protein